MSPIELVKARAVRALEGFRLEIEFSDGASGVVSLSDFLRTGPVMAPLRDPEFFGRAFLDMCAPTWPNGCDIDPTALRMRMKRGGTLRRPVAAG